MGQKEEFHNLEFGTTEPRIWDYSGPGFYALGRFCCLEIFKQIVDALLMIDFCIFQCVRIGKFEGDIDFAVLGK